MQDAVKWPEFGASKQYRVLNSKGGGVGKLLLEKECKLWREVETLCGAG